MRPIWIWIIAVVIFESLTEVFGQCGGAGIGINGGSGKIYSPNYPTDYLKNANCKWEFYLPNDGKAYSLVLTVNRLMLFLVVKTERQCPPTYTLAIDNVIIPCDQYSNVYDQIRSNDLSCKKYYKSTCTNIPEENMCDNKEMDEFPVRLTYSADMRLSPKLIESRSFFGFEVEYNYIPCPANNETNVSTITTPASETTTTKPTSVNETTTPASVSTARTVPTKVAGSTAMTKKTNQTGVAEPVSQSTIVIVVAAGLILFLLCLVAAILCAWKRFKLATGDNTPSMVLTLSKVEANTCGGKPEMQTPKVLVQHANKAHNYECIEARKKSSKNKNIQVEDNVGYENPMKCELQGQQQMKEFGYDYIQLTDTHLYETPLTIHPPIEGDQSNEHGVKRIEQAKYSQYDEVSVQPEKKKPEITPQYKDNR